MAQSSGERSVEPQAIVGIRRKLARAYSQLEYIQAQMDAYWKRKPVAAVSRFNEDATEYSSYLRIIEPPPIEWAVVFGEAVHNMRSALDHAIYQLTIAHSGKILPMTGFPIFIEMDRFFGCGGERQYKRSGIYQIRGLLPDAQTVIEGLQPYNNADPEHTVLWSLQEAWNKDKHRIIQLMTAVSKRTTLTMVPPAPGRSTIFNGLKEDGAQVAHIAFKQPSPHVKVHIELELHLVDKDSWDPEKPATITYEETLSEVADIINQLLVMMI